MQNRHPLTRKAVLAVSAELAGNPLDCERADAAARAMEPIMKLIDGLRTVPLKETEPATVFRPQQRRDD